MPKPPIPLESRAQGFLCAGLLCSAFLLSWVAHATDTVTVPVLKGEDLMSALRRVHPCFNTPGVKIPSQVFDDNPERVGRGGAMVLAHATLRLPASFLDPKTQCGPLETKTEPKVEASPPENHEAYHFRGGPPSLGPSAPNTPRAKKPPKTAKPRGTKKTKKKSMKKAPTKTT